MRPTSSFKFDPTQESASLIPLLEAVKQGRACSSMIGVVYLSVLRAGTICFFLNPR